METPLLQCERGTFRMTTAAGNDRSHVGRELDMILAGEKPLAMFYCNADSAPDERVIPERKFEKYVKRGDVVKQDLLLECAIDPRTKKQVWIRYVLYASSSEQWRIEAMRLALETMRKMGRADEGLDRIIASLLGHSPEEIDDLVQKSRKQYRLLAVRDYGDAG